MHTKERGSNFIRQLGGAGRGFADCVLPILATCGGDLTEEKDPSGFKYRIPFATQVEMFRFAVDKLKSSIKPALCKEDRALWKALGMTFDGCHCLLGRNDGIVKERTIEMKHARKIEHVIGIGKPLPVLA